MRPKSPRPKTPAQIARIQRHKGQRRAVDKLFWDAFKNGALTSPIYKAIPTTQVLKQVNGQKVKLAMIRPSSAMKRQIVTAWLRKGANKGTKVFPEDVIGAGEFVSSKGKRFTVKSFKKGELFARKPMAEKPGKLKIPRKWKTTTGGKFLVVLDTRSFGRIWAEFYLNDESSISRTTLEYGIVEAGRLTDKFFPSSEKKAEDLIARILERDLKKEQEGAGEVSD